MSGPWTGPRESDLANGLYELKHPVPPERWPYGPPEAHEDYCNLYSHGAGIGGLFCDCSASAEE